MIPAAQLADLRKEYTQKGLSVTETADHPVTQFTIWLEEALRAQLPEPTAMHLSTVSADGKPSGRIVLLKGLDERGFVFYTNYESRKGREISGDAYVNLTFFWPELERQVRVEGKTSKVSDEESDRYFHSRPRGSQLGAWASPQSQVIAARHELEEKAAQLEQIYGNDQEIPRPPHWGGFRVAPHAAEFWQGRPSRLHDRVLYTRQPDGSWQKARLAP